MRLITLALLSILIAACGTDTKTTTQKYLSAYDGNSVNVGYVAYTNWPKVGVLLPDSSIVGISASTGKYSGGLCNTGYCTSSSLESLLCDTSMCANHLPNPTSTSYCYFSTSDCSGTCYIPDKPIKNSVFVAKTGYLKATGSEAQVSAALRTAYRTDFNDCAIISPSLSAAPGSAYTASMYAPADSYSLPSGFALPVPTPISLAP